MRGFKIKDLVSTSLLTSPAVDWIGLRGFKIKDVPGDNNCQFHALTDQLEQLGISGWSAISMRKKTVQWLRENGEIRAEIHPRYTRDWARLGEIGRD